MTDVSDDKTADAEQAADERGLTQLKTLIQNEIKDALGGLRRPARDDTSDVEAQVRKAVADARAEDQRTAAEKKRDDRLKALEDKQDSKEKPPVQFRAIEKLFGWRVDGD